MRRIDGCAKSGPRCIARESSIQVGCRAVTLTVIASAIYTLSSLAKAARAVSSALSDLDAMSSLGLVGVVRQKMWLSDCSRMAVGAVCGHGANTVTEGNF